jgi:hypothetical protein
MTAAPAPSVALRVPPRAREAWSWLNEVLARVGAVPCQSGDPEAWWPVRERPDRAARAIQACHACAAQRACLGYALAADEPFGIWGGLLPEERKALRHQEGRQQGVQVLGGQCSIGRPV